MENICFFALTFNNPNVFYILMKPFKCRFNLYFAILNILSSYQSIERKCDITTFLCGCLNSKIDDKGNAFLQLLLVKLACLSTLQDKHCVQSNSSCVVFVLARPRTICFPLQNGNSLKKDFYHSEEQDEFKY
jgi:hypothetical protein